MQTQIAITLLVLRALERLAVKHMPAGSMAVFVYGVLRGTRDADIVAHLRPGDGARIAAELGPEFYFDVELAEEAIRRSECVSAIHMPTVFKVDIFALKPEVYETQALVRSIRHPARVDEKVHDLLERAKTESSK